MSDSPDGPRLSGLARSIDALFSAPPPLPKSAPEPVPTPVVPEVPAEVHDPPIEMVVLRTPGPSDPRPLAPEMFPSTQMLEAVPPAPPARTDVGQGAEPDVVVAADSGSETLLSFEAATEPTVDFEEEQA